MAIIFIYRTMSNDCKCTNSYYTMKPQFKLQTQTTHQATFKQYQIPKPPEFQPPKVVQRHYDPDVLSSSYKATFKQHKPMKQSYDSQSDIISKHFMNKPKNVPFYSETSYKSQYTPHPVVVQKQHPYQYKPKNTKFEGQSAYKSEFVEKKTPNISQTQQIITLKDYMGKKAQVAFEGRSSYKDTFKNHGVVHQKQPQYRYQRKQTKFEGQSSYKATFKPVPRQAYGRGHEYCPVHPDKVAIK